MDRLNSFQEETDPVGIIAHRRQCRRRQSKKGDEEDDENNFTSKNLEAERRRREKLHNRVLELRSHVPIITSMNKASVIDDAITYIRELQMKVETLTQQLHEIEASVVEEEMMDLKFEAINFEEEMKKYGIQEEVQVIKIGENKYWLKIISQKKSGFFTRFMEAMDLIGFVIVDISVTTCSGAILCLSSVQGIGDGSDDVEQTRNLLIEVMRDT